MVMKALLNRLAFRSEIGLAIGEREVAACEVATTLFGRFEVSRTSVPCEPDGLDEALGQLFSTWMRRGAVSQSRLTVGLPTLRVFFSTRPIQAKNQEATPLTLLHEVIQSPTLNLDDMAVDLIKSRVGGKPLASLASCRKRYLSAIMAGLEAGGVRPDRAEPAPCALVRVAAWKHRTPRKARSLVRVFLGRDQGLAVLAAGANLPLMWRPFDLPAGGESAAILAAVASVRILGGYCGLRSDVDAVLVHGRGDLGALPEVAGSPALQGIRVVRHDGPEMTEADVALGLAIAPAQGAASFNLIREAAGRNKLHHIFPWGQVIVQFLVLLATTLLLQNRLDTLQVERARVRVEGAKYPWAAKLPIEKLQAEKKDLEGRVEAVRGFLSGRALWTDLGRALSRRLTPELTLASIQGFYELESPGAKGNKPRRSLSLRVLAPIPRTGTLPPEIDSFVRQVRDDPTLKRQFAEVDLTDLRSVQGMNKSTSASFGVIFRPAKSGSGDAAKKKPGK